MTGDRSETIEVMRRRYLHEYRYINKKDDCIAFFEEIGEMAAAADASAWKKFADGVLAWVRKDMEGALALFEEALSLDPEFAYAWNGKGNVLADQRCHAEALTAYEKAIGLDPELAYAWNGKGNVLSDQKRYDESLAAYEKAITLDPELAYAWNGKGNVLAGQKRYGEALAAFEKAIAVEPELAYAWHGKGNVLRIQKRYDEALASYEKAISLDPEFAYPWNGKGAVLRSQKRYDEALAAYEKAIALDPEYASPWNGKGNVLSDLKRYDEALASYEKAISLDPEYAYPWNGKGAVLRIQKRYDEALAAYEKAIALDPEYASPWNGKGNVLFDLKRYDEALVSYEKAIALYSEYATPWNGKGNVLQSQKRYDEALASYEKAIALDPEHASPWHGKGNVLSDQKRYDEALAAYEKAIALDPQFASAWHGKGNVLKRQKRNDEALAAYEKAIALDPELAEPHYGLGMLHWEQERPRECAEAFRRAIELGLESPWKEVAESWIERAERMVASEEAGDSPEERDEADRSFDGSLVTDLFEAMKNDLPAIRKKKIDFKKQIAESVGKSRIVGEGGADDMLLVLRDWNSYSPILRRELRDQGGPGPDQRLGGGYLLVWKGHGIAIDPGVDFVTQLYRKGLSIADVDTVVITHCHLDHTRDVESLVDLNYRYNQANGCKPHPQNDDFRELQFCLCDSAFMKYRPYLKTSGCCRAAQLVRGGDTQQITDFIELQAVSVQHMDINGCDDEAIGLVLVLKDENGPVVRVGITSDSKWIESLPESFSDCDVLVAHLGTIEVGEEKAAASEKGQEAEDAGKDADGGGFLKTDLKNHLGTKGCFRLLQRIKPKIFVIGEFGEELVETRFKIIQVFHRLKPDETRFVLGGDSNLAIGLGKELSVCCSHRECARSWTRIPLDQVRPVLGGDFLFQYICPQHEITEELPS